MQIFALMMVRNEADIIRTNILYHSANGVDRFLIVDNGSSDGTQDILADLSHDYRIEWRIESGAYRQAETTTRLAQEAYKKGANWVIPIDADEFWYAPGTGLRQILGDSKAGALEVGVVNFIQRRSQAKASPDALLHMTRRSAAPVGPLERVRELIETRQYGFVEALYSTKWISRASPELEIKIGDHRVANVPGFRTRMVDIVCLHAPLRARTILLAKAEQGIRLRELDLDPSQGWHVIRWSHISDEAELDREWRANSYQNDCLEVDEGLHPVVYDPTLREVVSPWCRADSGLVEEQWELERKELLLATQRQASAYVHETERIAEVYREGITLRDQMIRDLQADRQIKIGQRDELIRALQAELHAKVGERDATIQRLQAERNGLEVELPAKIAERDSLIQGMQAESSAKIKQRDITIDGLQAELHSKVAERDEIINALQAELHAKVGERDEIIQGLQAELHAKVGERDEIVRRLQAELRAASAHVTISSLLRRWRPGKKKGA